jgi:hypothetical protein
MYYPTMHMNDFLRTTTILIVDCQLTVSPTMSFKTHESSEPRAEHATAQEVRI